MSIFDTHYEEALVATNENSCSLFLRFHEEIFPSLQIFDTEPRCPESSASLVPHVPSQAPTIINKRRKKYRKRMLNHTPSQPNRQGIKSYFPSFLPSFHSSMHPDTSSPQKQTIKKMPQTMRPHITTTRQQGTEGMHEDQHRPC